MKIYYQQTFTNVQFQMMAKNLKLHRIKLTIKIHRIKLKVRFPCSISTILKIENEEIQISPEMPLKDGESIIEQKLTKQLRLSYNQNTARYVEKKAAVVVILKSATGKIPAGSVQLDLTKNRLGGSRIQQKIDKCPDKNATIQFTYDIQSLGQTDYYEENQDFQKQLNNNYLRQQKRISPQRDFDIDFEGKSEKNFFSSKRRELSKNSYARERERELSPLSRNNYRNYASSRDKLDSSYERSDVLKRMKSSEKPVMPTRNGMLNDYFPQTKSTTVQNLNKVLNLQREVQNHKQKASHYEVQLNGKKHKTLQLQKELKLLQKKFQQQQIDTKSIITKKDIQQKSLKQMEKHYKDLKQKYEQINTQFQTLNKRFEYKENSYKEQIKNLNQKFSASQNDKQNLIQEKNNLAFTNQDKQKKMKEGWREKEKKLNEEKYQLSRKNELLIKEMNLLNQSKQENKLKISEMARQIKELMSKIHHYEIQKQESRKTSNQLKIEIFKEQNHNKILSQRLLLLQKLELDKKSLSRRVQELQIQISRQNKTVTSLKHELMTLKSHKEELQSDCKQSHSNVRKMEVSYNNLIKQYEQLQYKQEADKKQLVHLTYEYESQKAKLEKIQDEWNQMRINYEQEKQMCKEDQQKKDQKINELEQDCQQFSQQAFMLNQQLQNIQAQLQQLRHENDQKYLAIQSLESQLIQLNQVNTNYQGRTIELSENKKVLEIRNQQLHSQKNQKIHQLEETIEELEQITSHLKQQLAAQTQRLKNRIQDLFQQIKSKQQEISKLNDDVTVLESNSVRDGAQIQQIKHEVKIKANQTAFLREQLEKYKQQSNSLQNQLYSIKKDKEKTLSEYDRIKQEHEHSVKQLANKTALTKKLKDELQQYRKNNYTSVKNFCTLLLNRDSHSNNSMNNPSILDSSNFSSALNTINQDVFSLHQESEIAMCMNEALRKNNRTLVEIENNLKIKEASVGQLYEATQKLKKIQYELRQSKDELQRKLNQIKRSFEQQKNFKEQVESQLKGQKADYLKIVKQKQQQISKQSDHITQITSQINQKNREIFSLKNQIQDLSALLRSSQANVKEGQDSFRIYTEKKQKQRNTIISEMNEQVRRFEQKLKNQIEKNSELEQDKVQAKKELKLQKDNLKKVMKELQNQLFENEKTQNQLQDQINQNSKRKSTITSLQSAIMQLKLKSQNLSSQSDSIRIQLESARNNMQKKTAQYSSQLQALLSKEEQQNQQIEQHKGQIKFLQTTIKEQDQKISLKSLQIKKIQQQFAAGQKIIKKKEEQVEEINNLFSTNKKDGDGLQAKLKNLFNQKSQLEAICIKQKQALKRLQVQTNQKIGEQDQKMEKLKKKLKQQQRKCENVQTQSDIRLKSSTKVNESLRQESHLNQKLLQQAKSVMELIKKTNNQLSAQIKNLQKQNKVQRFYFFPLKQCGKKIESSLSAFDKQLLAQSVLHSKIKRGQTNNINLGSNLNLSTTNNMLNASKDLDKQDSNIVMAKKSRNRQQGKEDYGNVLDQEKLQKRQEGKQFKASSQNQHQRLVLSKVQSSPDNALSKASQIAKKLFKTKTSMQAP